MKKVLYKKLFLEISQSSQENLCARVSFLIKLQPLGLLIVYIIKSYYSCCIMLMRIDTILSKNIWNKFQNLLFKKLLAQSGDQADYGHPKYGHFTRLQEHLDCPNRGASVRLHHWGNLMTASVFFIHHFLLLFATQLIETRFFLFWNMFCHSFRR